MEGILLARQVNRWRSAHGRIPLDPVVAVRVGHAADGRPIVGNDIIREADGRAGGSSAVLDARPVVRRYRVSDEHLRGPGDAFRKEARGGAAGDDDVVSDDSGAVAHRDAEVAVVDVHVVERRMNRGRGGGGGDGNTGSGLVANGNVVNVQLAATVALVADAATITRVVAVDPDVLDQHFAVRGHSRAADDPDPARAVVEALSGHVANSHGLPELAHGGEIGEVDSEGVEAGIENAGVRLCTVDCD